jgi:hypothetical protein
MGGGWGNVVRVLCASVTKATRGSRVATAVICRRAVLVMAVAHVGKTLPHSPDPGEPLA